MIRASCVVLGLLVLACSTGCGPSAAVRLAGKWELDAEKTMEDSNPVDIKIGGQEIGGGLFKELAKTIKVDFEFKTDGTMSTTFAGLIGSAKVTSGKWKVVKSKGDEVTISQQTDGESAHEMTLKFLDNDTFQTKSPVAGQEMLATFRRVKKE